MRIFNNSILEAKMKRPLPPMVYSVSLLKRLHAYFVVSANDAVDNPATADELLRDFFEDEIRLTDGQIEDCFILLGKPYTKTIFSEKVREILSNSEQITPQEEQSLIHEAYVKLLDFGAGNVVTMETDGFEKKFKSYTPNAKAILDALKIRSELLKLTSSKNYETFEEMENRYKEIYKKYENNNTEK